MCWLMNFELRCKHTQKPINPVQKGVCKKCAFPLGADYQPVVACNFLVHEVANSLEKEYFCKQNDIEDA